MEQRVVAEGASMDSFDNVTPIEPSSAEASGGQQSQGFESFDDTTPVLPETKDGEGAEEQKQAKEPEDSKEPEIKRETDKLEDQEKDSDDKSDKRTEKEDDGEEGTDKSDEEAESDKQEDSGDKPKGKTVRAKAGDEAIDLPLDATVPVKVKGKKEFVSIEDLQKNYSGHKAWSEEIETAKAERMQVDQEREEFTQAREATKAHFAKIGGMLEDAFSNPEADPLAAMKYLVELGGRDVLEFEKRMMDHYGNLSMSFNEMSEAEQELYWTRRHNQILTDSQAARKREIEERTAQEQRVQQVSQIREKYGISEDEYNATEQELSQQGYDLNEVTPEQISHYAALKPLVAKSIEITKQFEDELGDNEMDALIRGTADAMFKFPQISEVEALRISAKSLGFEITSEEEMVDHLKSKDQTKEPVIDRKAQDGKKVVKPKEDRYESFDDFDDLYYK